MRYIDKNNTNRAAGNQVTLDYLNAHCKDANGHYCGILYRNRGAITHPDFLSCGTPSYYNRMVSILMKEQGNRCCYCLRRLQEGMPNCDETVTIEHIVPQGFDRSKRTEFEEYKDFASNIKDNVELTDVYELQPGAQTMPPFPHKVAYDNMVVSCNGSFPSGINGGACCNIHRDQERALPVYFLTDIAEQIDYQKNGDIFAPIDAASSSEIEEVIYNANLACDPLKDIRQVWYELSAREWGEIIQCDTEAKRAKLLTDTFAPGLMIRNQNEANRLIAKFSIQEYWHTLMLYDVFYTIMRDKYRMPLKKNSASE